MPRFAALFTMTFVTFGIFAGACSSSGQKTARTFLYAPEFRYYEEGEIKNTMHVFAAEVSQLERVLRKEEKSPEDQKAVIKHLKAMEEAASELATSGHGSSHPIFDRYLDDLRRDLAVARVAASREPPDYFLAGSITGSCVACHRTRR